MSDGNTSSDAIHSLRLFWIALDTCSRTRRRSGEALTLRSQRVTFVEVLHRYLGGKHLVVVVKTGERPFVLTVYIARRLAGEQGDES